jgi:hypothetical protein
MSRITLVLEAARGERVVQARSASDELHELGSASELPALELCYRFTPSLFASKFHPHNKTAAPHNNSNNKHEGFP